MSVGKMAEKGERIYRSRYQKELEREHEGEFVAIELSTEKYYLGATVDEALSRATEDNPDGQFHVVRVGHRSVYHLNSLVGDQADWDF